MRKLLIPLALLLLVSCSSEEEKKKQELLEKKFHNKNLHYVYHGEITQPGMPVGRHDLTNHVFTFTIGRRDFLLVTKGGSSGGLNVTEITKEKK